MRSPCCSAAAQLLLPEHNHACALMLVHVRCTVLPPSLQQRAGSAAAATRKRVCTHGPLRIGPPRQDHVMKTVSFAQDSAFSAGGGQKNVVQSLGEWFARMPLTVDAAATDFDSARSAVSFNRAEFGAAGKPVSTAFETPAGADVGGPDPPSSWDRAPCGLTLDTPLPLQPQRTIALQTDRDLEAANRADLPSTARSAAQEAGPELLATPALPGHGCTCPTSDEAAGMPATAAVVKTEQLPTAAVQTEQPPSAGPLEPPAAARQCEAASSGSESLAAAGGNPPGAVTTATSNGHAAAAVAAAMPPPGGPKAAASAAPGAMAPGGHRLEPSTKLEAAGCEGPLPDTCAAPATPRVASGEGAVPAGEAAATAAPVPPPASSSEAAAALMGGDTAPESAASAAPVAAAAKLQEPSATTEDSRPNTVPRQARAAQFPSSESGTAREAQPTVPATPGGRPRRRAAIDARAKIA